MHYPLKENVPVDPIKPSEATASFTPLNLLKFLTALIHYTIPLVHNRFEKVLLSSKAIKKKVFGNF